MKEIFISYSTIDIASAETVRNVLEQNGLSCWMAPRDIPGGSNYTKEIPNAIRNCKAFVLILSANAQSSHWVLKELDSAVNAGKVILPFMVEDCALNDEFNFLLTGAQRYAAYQKKAEAMEILIGRLRGILGIPEPVPADEPAPQPEPAVRPAPAAKPEPVTKPTVAAASASVVCTACGSSDVKPMPKKVKRKGIKELSTLVLIPLMGLACAFACFILYEIFWFSLFGTGLMAFFDLLPFAALIGGGFWGNAISKKIVRRSRLRQRIHATCYRCKTCDKFFLFDETAT